MSKSEASMVHDGAANMLTAKIVTPELVRSLREDGAVLIKNALSAEDVAIVKEAFDYHLAKVSDFAIDQGTEHTRFVIDLQTSGLWDAPPFQRFWNETRLLDLAEAIYPDGVWLWYEQIFYKAGSAGETVKRTDWHQDTVYDPLEGEDQLRFWMSLEALDKDCALEFVRGSHRGPVYDPNPASGKTRTIKGQEMPAMPDIESDRDQWDILSWAMEPGDILAFHPGIIHGGGATKPNGLRRTLSIYMFGRDVRYSPRAAPPAMLRGEEADSPYQQQLRLLDGLEGGEPMWKSKARRLR